MAIALQKVLIADDHQPMRQMIKSIVADLVSEAFEAADGAETLRIYRERQPDLVLIDLVMPGMSGLEATRSLVAEFPKARVVVVTGQNQEVLRKAAREAGACGYVLKENLTQIRSYFEKSDIPWDE